MPRTRQTVVGLILALMAMLGGRPEPAACQNTARSVEKTRWFQVTNEVESELPFQPRSAADSISGVGFALLAWYGNEGYYAARIDSIVEGAEGVGFYVDPGGQTVIRDISFSGVTVFSTRELLASLDSRVGQPLRPDVLERDLARILRKYESRGYVLAHIEIARLSDEDRDGGLDLVLHISEGELLRLEAVELPGSKRTRASYVANVLGLRPGAELQRYDADLFTQRLQETGLFVEVDSIRLAVSENQGAVLRLWLNEDVPGSFDAAIGYLPGSSGQGGTVVGNVNILLRHIFGAGREFDFNFHRLPRSTSRVHVRLADPFAFGLPLRLGANFDGLQQDSTYDNRRYGLEGGVRIADGLEIVVTGSRELTRPGSADLVAVPSSDSWFAGLGFRYLQIDRRINTRSGFEVSSHLETGRKKRDRRELSPTDLADEVIRQQRFGVKGRAYVPVALRHVAVAGIDMRGVQSPSYDLSDLIRLGGAQSLRGYNEEQFRGNIVARLMTEWRYLVDRTSHLFVFFDLGYYGAPEVGTSINVTERRNEFLTGYGLGIELGTGAGQFSVSLGFNRDEGLDAKVHLGMSLGL